MPPLKIVLYPDDPLTRRADPVPENRFGARLEAFARQMLEAMERFDGVGLAAPANHEGLGMHIMKYRAGLILADLNIYNHAEGGTVVECRYAIE